MYAAKLMMENNKPSIINDCMLHLYDINDKILHMLSMYGFRGLLKDV
ncbi:hypothetical protein KB20921_11940 [Edwardsiella ictaluri]|nr:hypothetical protein KH20906_11620 [Edwardsiella ictaluri]BEI01933.1 hypothetical protein KB20921_11940 [Edwardsiella ictaluri]BEI05401.1 hypothetical protein KH201010_11870 [Edwardsiella ictaluri]BEI12339.1 hypothetical protein STU22816_11920 [Edwardsiella ictaluri]BEI19291.1 hypothetical protein STH22820_11910 [Edwardsiella ictaluri]